MASGLTTVVPWPKAAAARSAAEPPLETLPVKASTPRSHVAAEAQRGAGLGQPVRRPASGASAANAVLHDLAKSVRNGTLPSAKSSEFLNERPSTVKVFGQATLPSRVTAPASSRPSAVTILNVEPGGTCAVNARFSAAAVRAVGGGEHRAVADPHGDQRGAQLLRRQRRVGGDLGGLVEGGLQRRARLGLAR